MTTPEARSEPADEQRAFWKSAGLHLLERNACGWLDVTPAFVFAYLTRPEIHPIDDSCDAERALHAALLDNPMRPVADHELAAIADADTVDNYRVVLGFRDHLLASGTIEAAYLSLIRAGTMPFPPVFLDQMVHVIARNMLDGTRDPFRLRAAEILFRAQKVSTPDGTLMLADEEILEMQAQMGNIGLAQLLSDAGTAVREVALDVMNDETADQYWARSDRFDMVVDFRFEQPTLDAFARVLETWLHHLMGLSVRVEPRPRLDDPAWRWHIGLDATASRLLDRLYAGETLSDDEARQIVGLFRMTILDDDRVIDRLKRRPIYLALAMDDAGVVRMKPQNLLANLPLIANS